MFNFNGNIFKYFTKIPRKDLLLMLNCVSLPLVNIWESPWSLHWNSRRNGFCWADQVCSFPVSSQSHQDERLNAAVFAQLVPYGQEINDKIYHESKPLINYLSNPVTQLLYVLRKYSEFSILILFTSQVSESRGNIKRDM